MEFYICGKLIPLCAHHHQDNLHTFHPKLCQHSSCLTQSFIDINLASLDLHRRQFTCLTESFTDLMRFREKLQKKFHGVYVLHRKLHVGNSHVSPRASQMFSIGSENDSKNENDATQNNTIATSKFCIVHGLPKFKIIKEIQQLKFFFFFKTPPLWILKIFQQQNCHQYCFKTFTYLLCNMVNTLQYIEYLQTLDSQNVSTNIIDVNDS